MCVKCDIKAGLKPRIQFLGEDQQAVVDLPPACRELDESGFHQDLMQRMRAHAAYAEVHGFSRNAAAVLQVIGEGFTPAGRFHPGKFAPIPGEQNESLKTKALAALTELSDFYGDRVPAIIWQSFAFLATREEPEIESSIIKEAGDENMPAHYTIVDSCLHACGLVYTFMLHVQSVMFKHTGRILNHNCDCSCSLVNLEALNGHVQYVLPRQNIVPATQSLLTHLLAETVKLQELFLPFAYSITPEAPAIRELLRRSAA